MKHLQIFFWMGFTISFWLCDFIEFNGAIFVIFWMNRFSKYVLKKTDFSPESVRNRTKHFATPPSCTSYLFFTSLFLDPWIDTRSNFLKIKEKYMELYFVPNWKKSFQSLGALLLYCLTQKVSKDFFVRDREVWVFTLKRYINCIIFF